MNESIANAMISNVHACLSMMTSRMCHDHLGERREISALSRSAACRRGVLNMVPMANKRTRRGGALAFEWWEESASVMQY